MGKGKSLTQKYAAILAGEQGGWFCIYCGKELPEYEPHLDRRSHMPEVDHIVPTARGGTDDLSNLALSCVSCNSIKRRKTGHEFVLWRREWLRKQDELRELGYG